MQKAAKLKTIAGDIFDGDIFEDAILKLAKSKKRYRKQTTVIYPTGCWPTALRTNALAIHISDEHHFCYNFTTCSHVSQM